MEDQIAGAIAGGLSGLIEYSVLGIFACIGMGFMVWSAYNCSKSTKEGLDNSTEALRDLKDSNTELMNGIRILLTEIKGRLDK